MSKFLCLFALSNNALARQDWSSLSDGLKAWEFFNLDKDFTYEVRVSDAKDVPKTVFKYPSGLTEFPMHDSDGVDDPDIIIKGAKTEYLKKITIPHVKAILAGKDPGSTSGRNSVSRQDYTAHGGLTLPGLVKATGRNFTKGDKWQILRDGIDAWASLDLDIDFSVNVGTKDGTLFTYTKGKTGMNKKLPGASLSKWPAAMTIAGLVADGTLSFDDKINKYLDWWATDPNDKRSQITLRHLLTFQSGYMDDENVQCAMNPFADFISCAKDLYNVSKHSGTPGTRFAYISTHLQFAGAMAVAASGLRPDKLFKKYLYEPIGMNGTSWSPARNPQFATGIRTTGNDFEKMLRKILTHEFLGKTVLDEMEKDWGAQARPSGDGWFGHYAMGHWFDCMDYAAGQSAGSSAKMPQYCLDENIPAGPGAYGFFPLVDRKRGYYFQIVLAEDSDCRSEIPEYLRIIAKPVVDAIIEDTPIDDEHLLAAPHFGGLLVREILDMYNYVPPQCNPGVVV
jgi:hypothetical protein